MKWGIPSFAPRGLYNATFYGYGSMMHGKEGLVWCVNALMNI